MKPMAVHTTSIAFAKLDKEIQWSNDERVKYLFMIAVPTAEAGDTHLQVLAHLSRMMMSEEFREGIRNSKKKEDILKIVAL